MINFVLRCASLLPIILLLPVAQAADPNDEIKTAARASVEAMAKSDWIQAAVNFDVNLRKAAPAEKLEAAWKPVLEKYGALEKVLGMRVDKNGSGKRVTVQCEFKKGKLDVGVNFDDKGKIIGFLFMLPKGDYKYDPPPYVKKEQFSESEVKVGLGERFLPGTLTLPKGMGPFPAIVLLPGSGPQDRDETIGPNKPLRDLAWGLAMHGIASVRFEKRTSMPEKLNHIKPGKLTLKEEVIDDALAAVFLLCNHTAIDRKKVYIVGHSLGAMVVPRILTLEPAIAGGVLLAGNQRPLPEVILDQLKYLEELAGKNLPADQKKEIDKVRAEIALIQDEKITKEPLDKMLFNAPVGYWLYLRDYDQGATAAKVKQPLLLLQGERDYQVTMTDFAGWKKVLANRTNVEYKSYPTLNHLFIPGEGKASPAEYTKAGYVDPAVLDDIAQWLKKQ